MLEVENKPDLGLLDAEELGFDDYLKLSEMYGRIKVKIRGRTPLLMHRCLESDIDDDPIQNRLREFPSHEEYARAHRYTTKIDGKEYLCIWAQHVYCMILEAAKGRKIGKTAARNFFAGNIRIEPEEIPLMRDGKYIDADDYKIDVRPACIPGSRGKSSRILRARARVDEWEAEFYILFDVASFTSSALKLLEILLREGGKKCGLLDYRPQHLGWFGTFIVEKFEVEEITG